MYTQDEIKKGNGFFEPLGIFLTLVGFDQTSFHFFSNKRYFPRSPFWQTLIYWKNGKHDVNCFRMFSERIVEGQLNELEE